MRRTALLVIAAVPLTLAAAAPARNGFKPADGHYAGTAPGHGTVRVDVGGFLRPDTHQLPAVRLTKWSAKLRCPGHRSRTESAPMTAARVGRTFSGYQSFPGGKLSFEGEFTDRNSLTGTIRAKRMVGAV